MHSGGDDHWDPGLLTRGRLLGVFGGLVASAAGLNACGGGGGGGSSTPAAAASAASSSTAAAGAAAACTVTPEGEIGPYFTDDSAAGYNRSNILANLDGTGAQTGVPLTLTVFVYDTEKSCAAYDGAQVDIWHCNASGVYSNESVENTSGQSWLRGYQLTDASGKVTFQTIVPGWYRGRTTHIHLRVRSTYSEASSTSDETNTTQLFFAQALVNTFAQSLAPYSAEGLNDTTNATDHVYADETKGANLLSLAGSTTAGYTTTIALGLPIGG